MKTIINIIMLLAILLSNVPVNALGILPAKSQVSKSEDVKDGKALASENVLSTPRPAPAETQPPGKTELPEMTSTMTPATSFPTETPAPTLTPVPAVTASTPDYQISLTTDAAFVHPGETAVLAWASQMEELLEGDEVVFQFGPGVQSIDGQNELRFPAAANGELLFFITEAAEPPFQVVASLRRGEEILAQDLLELFVRHDVSSKGGTVDGLNGIISVSFPKQALQADAQVFINRPTAISAPSTSLSGAPFEINAFRADATLTSSTLTAAIGTPLEVDTFSQPIQIDVAYDESLYPGKEGDLGLYWYNEQIGAWEALPGSVDTSGNVIHAFTTHFTVFDIGVNNYQASHLPTIDAFQVSGFTGAATFNYPIELPPGPGGLQPRLSLSYNSQVIDQSVNKTQASWVGMGWSLDYGSIERNSNGTSQFEGDDTFMLNVNGVSSTIASASDGYHLLDENFWRIERNGDASWKVLDIQGNIYYFEKTVSYHYPYQYSDNNNNLRCEFNALPSKWYLTRMQNAFGQTIQYTYVDETKPMLDLSKKRINQQQNEVCYGDSSVQVVTATYPATILYPHGHYRVRFELSGRTDYPSEWVSDAAYHEFLRSRLSNIYVEQDGNGDGGFETVIRRYELSYFSDLDTSQLIWPGISWTAGGKTSTLAGIKQYGQGGSVSLPANSYTFSYVDGTGLDGIDGNADNGLDLNIDHMHLLKARNGHGGEIEFKYDVVPWFATTASKSYLLHEDYPCFEGTSNWQGSDSACAEYWQLGKRFLLFRGRVQNLYYNRDLVRPGGIYRLSANVAEVIGNGHYEVRMRYDDADRIVTPVFDDYIQLPSTAVRADPVFGTPDTARIAIYDIDLQLVTSIYRVMSKKIVAGAGSVPYTVHYNYSGAATNDDAHSTAGNYCGTGEPITTCAEYTEKYSEFRGHARVEEIVSFGGTPDQDRHTITEYKQDDVLKGKPWRVTIQDGNGKVFTQNESGFGYTNFPISPLYVYDCHVCLPYRGLSRNWIYPQFEINRIYNGNGSAYTATKTLFATYDSYGNLTRAETYASLDMGISWELQRVVENEYYPNLALNLVSLPASERIKDRNGNLLSQTLFLYGGNTGNYAAAPANAILTGSRTWVGDPRSAPDTRYSQVSFGYDGWGNQTSITTYRGYGTAASSPLLGEQTLTKSYDSYYGTYLVAETNPLGQTTRLEYNYTLGLPSREIDANNVSVSAIYDAFGRLTQLIRPEDTTDQPSFQVAYSDSLSGFNVGSGLKIWLKQKLNGDNDYIVSHQYDGLGRETITVNGDSFPENGTVQRSPDDAIQVEYEFDALGRLASQSTPYTVSEAAFWTTNRYDILGRTTQVHSPDGTHLSSLYDGLTIVSTDSKGRSTTSVANVWGQVVRVTPPEGPKVEYSYDVLGRLVLAKRGRAETAIAYDALGRKTVMDDPDMGHWSYVYDANGNLVTQTDARLCSLNLQYDAINRLIGKTSSGSGCNVQVNTVYQYDQGFYGKGRRTSMLDSSGKTTWKYDSRGRMTEESKTIGAYGPFVTTWGYNFADLPVSITYPGGEVVTTTYNNRMLMESLSGTDVYVSSLQYDSAGRMIQRQLGNGLTQTWGYYAWNAENQGGRLRETKTGILQNGSFSSLLQHLSYSYDSVGNIATITDHSARQELAFGYDSLDRLVEASATSIQIGGGLPQTYYNGDYSETYVYSPSTGNLEWRINNMATNERLNLYYPTPSESQANHPHAVIAAGNNSYGYDANGNQVTRTLDGQTSTLLYDAENRLVAVDMPGTPTATPTAQPSPTPVASPTPVQQPVRGDFDGDLKADPAVYIEDSAGSQWHIEGMDMRIYGTSGDVPIPADYNGDGKTEIAVYRPSDGKWFVAGMGNIAVWGTSTDIPVPGDYNGDGKDDVAFYRPASGIWSFSGIGIVDKVWGIPGDIPIPADYNGDGKTDIAVYRPPDGTSDGTWYIAGASVAATVWGIAGDIPAPADFTGDGKAEMVVFRPSDGKWYIKNVGTYAYGINGDQPLPADFTGDGVADRAVFRASNQTWYVAGRGPIPVNLVGHWSFDTDVDTQIKDSARNNTGNLVGGSHSPSGISGPAISLSNTSYGSIPYRAELEPTNSLTVSVWVYPTARVNGTTYTILNKGGATPDYELRVNGSGNLEFRLGDLSATALTASPLPLNNWSLVTGVYDKASGWMKLYVNGVLVASRVVSGAITWNGSALLFGTSSSTGSWVGSLDDVRLYNRALKDVEIYKLYRDFVPYQSPAAPAGDAAFQYDGDGRQVVSVINGVTTLYVGSHYEFNATSGEVTKYYFAGAARVAMRKYIVPQNMTLNYLIGDHLGSTSIVTDSSGAKVSEMRYKAWGELRYTWVAPGALGGKLPDYTYTGQRSDSYINLLWYGSRHYDPELGRFIQADSIVPLATQGTQAWDRYAYVNNNPVKYTDPDGHCVSCVVLGLTALGLLPDIRGITIALATASTNDAVTAAGIAVQSQWLSPADIAGSGGLGIAQVSNAQMIEYAIHNPDLEGGNQLIPSVAIKAMETRINIVVDAYDKWCGNMCNDTDRLIVAALAQNGSEFDQTMFTDIGENYMSQDGSIDWQTYLSTMGKNPDPRVLWRQQISRKNFGTELMLKMYIQDLEILKRLGYKLPDRYQNADFKKIKAFIQ